MGKKVICLLFLFVFLVFNFSCYSISEKRVETITRWKGKKAARVKIQAITKRNGHKIEFKQDSPGRIVRGGIRGVSSAPSKKQEIYQSEISKIFVEENNSIKKILLKTGQVINPVYAAEDNDKVVVYTSETIFVPFSEIQSLRVSYFDFQTTLLIVAGILLSYLVR